MRPLGWAANILTNQATEGFSQLRQINVTNSSPFRENAHDPGEFTLVHNKITFNTKNHNKLNPRKYYKSNRFPWYWNSI